MSGDVAELTTVLQFADSAFPSGSFGFSNGIEALAAHGRLTDTAEISAALSYLLRHRWACADRIALARAHRSSADLTAVAVVDREFDAASPCAPLRDGSARNGLAYVTSHARLGTSGASDYRVLVLGGQAPGHFPVVQGLLLGRLGLDEQTAIGVSCYTTASGMAQAAVRLGCLGALDAQRAIQQSIKGVRELVTAPPPGSDFSMFTPFSEIATVGQARADVRLFGN